MRHEIVPQSHTGWEGAKNHRGLRRTLADYRGGSLWGFADTGIFRGEQTRALRSPPCFGVQPSPPAPALPSSSLRTSPSTEPCPIPSLRGAQTPAQLKRIEAQRNPLFPSPGCQSRHLGRPPGSRRSTPRCSSARPGPWARCGARGGRRRAGAGGSGGAGSSLRTNPAARRRACGEAAAAPALLKRGGSVPAAPRGGRVGGTEGERQTQSIPSYAEMRRP